MIINFDMIENENEEQYTWRLCNAKSSGLIECSWKDVADTINNLFKNENEYLNESAYRKPYQSAKRYFDSNVFSSDSEENAKLKELIVKLEKEKIKIRDARNDYKDIVRQQARKECFYEELESIIDKNVAPLPLIDYKKGYRNDNDNETDILIPLTDLHVGLDIDNCFNQYNKKIFVDRVHKYFDKINDICQIHNSKNAYIVISELISGYIHTDLVKDTSMTMIEQLIFALDTICPYIIDMSTKFDNVFIYCVAGNHSRINANKKESIKGNNLDILAIPYLKARLQYYLNVLICKNIIDDYIATFYIRDNFVVASHGDRDRIESCVKDYTLLCNKKPDIVLLGHRHANSVTTIYDTKVIQSGCMSGTDSYAIDLRVKNKPEQIVTIVNTHGVECYYDIQLG